MCLAISAKRYVVYSYGETGEIDVRKRSEHGLGRYLPPITSGSDEAGTEDRGWVDEAWRWVIRAHDNPETPLPPWADQPALSRITVSSPALARPFRVRNEGKRWADQIKPFNFLLVADLDPFGRPPGTDPSAFRLISPYRSANERDDLRWQNVYGETSRTYEVTTDPTEFDSRLVGIKSYGQVLREYRVHPEHKSLGPDGQPCRRNTRGVLGRRPVTVVDVVYIGKEANRLEAVRSGIAASLDEVLQRYQGPTDHVLHELVIPGLAHLSGRELARMVGTDRRTIDRLRRGQRPRPKLRDALVRLAIRLAVDDLGLQARPTMQNSAAILRAWQTEHP